MTNFSRKFTSLLESMKSSNFIMEDDADGTKKERSGLFGDRTSTGKSQSRSDRKEQRLEDRFDKKGDDKFLVRAYIKAVELLKDQVLATRIDIFNTIKNKLAGAKYGDPILRSADTLLALMINLKINAEKLAKEEGSRLEPIKNAEDIKTYKSLYAENEKEYEELKKKWNEAKLKEQNEQPVLAANQKIEKSLNIAKKYFTEAQTEFGANFAQFVQKKGEEKKEEVKKDDSSTATGLTTTLKERDDVYTGTDGDLVKEVKKLIYNKFRKYATLKNSSDWKAVYKNWPTVTGSLRTNTANVIKAVKKGSATDYPDLASDKTGDITPKFLEILRGIKEGLSYNTSKIVSFESFMKNRISEAFDEEAAGTVLSKASTKKSKSSSSSSSGKSSVPSEPATPFKTKEDGNKFREWVNKKYPDWAKENNLDASGSENNTYIRKAYAQYGQEYNKATSTPEVKKMDGKQMNNLLAKIKEYSKKVELQLTTGSGEPVILFYTGKVYGHIYNNYMVSYVNTEGGKKVWWGTYNSEKEFVSFGSGKHFNLKSVVLCSITEGLTMTKEESEKAAKADELLAKMSDMIVAKFGDTSFWKPFKGTFNDDEDAAVAAFSKWYGSKIEDAYYNPAINRIKQLPTSKAKENLMKNVSNTSDRFQFDKLINKLYGSTSNDTYKWTIYKSNGTSKSYNVDTDF